MADVITILRAQYEADVTEAREAGAAEVRARVEAVGTFDAWLTVAPGVRVRVMHERDVRAALNGGES